MMAILQPTKTNFAKRVRGFKMKVFHDEGIYRHIRFGKTDTQWDSFDIVTWPGHLSYSGDMGDYTFERLPDMFEFFRNDTGGINPGYWGEKLQAVDRRNGWKEYSPDKYEDRIKEWFNEYWEFDNPKQKREAWENIEWDGLLNADSEEGAHHKAYNYECPITKQEFNDFWECDLKDYTFHYIYCCRAIVWGIEKYDKYKEKQNVKQSGNVLLD